MSVEDQREALTQYMARRGLTRKGWAKAAKLSSVNTITNFLNGHSKSISTTNLHKLSEYSGDPIEVLIGATPDPLIEQKKTGDTEIGVLASRADQLSESEVQNLQLMLQELRSIRRSQERLTEVMVEVCDVLRSSALTGKDRLTNPESQQEDSEPPKRRVRR